MLKVQLIKVVGLQPNYNFLNFSVASINSWVIFGSDIAWPEKSIIFNSDFTNLDLVINTTPLGMYKEDSEDFFNIPVNESTILIDLIYTARETLFLKKFDKCSKRINGLDMFIFQALKSIEIWRETNYNLDSQIESVRKQLENIKC